MTLKSRTLTESSLKQTIDLEELLGRRPTASESSAFEIELLEKIIGRTQDGKDVNGKSFINYTEEYAETKGVSRSDVDLTLFGDMLLSMETSSSKGKIDLTIEGEEAAKAYGHVSGFKGHPTIKNGPKRDFFGVSDREAKQIANNIKEASTQSIADLFTASRVLDSEESRNEILNNIGLFTGDGGLFG